MNGMSRHTRTWSPALPHSRRSPTLIGFAYSRVRAVRDGSGQQNKSFLPRDSNPRTYANRGVGVISCAHGSQRERVLGMCGRLR